MSVSGTYQVGQKERVEVKDLVKKIGVSEKSTVNVDEGTDGVSETCTTRENLRKGGDEDGT